MSFIQKKSGRSRVVLALGATFGTVGALSVQSLGSVAYANTSVTAGSFDLTKQATEPTFPVTFDRPSGVNAAALAGTVRNLGSDSQLYKSAVAAVPELADSVKMQRLLSNAMSEDAAAKSEARTTIVKLINWYNSLGGAKITTQAGATYTVDNLDQPINTIAVAFSSNGTINSQISTTINNEFKNVRTVQDVMTIFDRYQAGTSTGYKNAFDTYAAKYAAATDKASVSTYESVLPVLTAYEKMYSDGATAIRKQLLSGSATATEAGVAFFESAVITGTPVTSDGGGTTTNTPTPQTYTTRWVDESGKHLSAEITGNNYGEQKTISGYTFKSVSTNGNIRTYVYTQNKTVTSDTVWVDESGAVLKDKVTGTFPDTDGVSDIPGYSLVSTKTTTDTDGNTHVVNTYHKIVEDTVWVDEAGNVLKTKTSGTLPDTDGKSDIDGYTLVKYNTVTDPNGDKHTVNTYRKNDTPVKDLPDTYWFDDKGNTLKDKANDQTLPDNDGVSDIAGYKVLRVYTVTADDLKGDFKDTSFGVGDTINIYTKEAETPKPNTHWVDESGKKLQDSKEGTFPDNDGKTDIPGYTLVEVRTDEATGDVTNVYRKNPETPGETPKKTVTNWVDESGKKLQDTKDGSFPDNDGKSDIPGHVLVRTDVDKDGNVTNVYKPLVTKWVDTTGKQLQDPKTGTFPDNDGKSDIPGHTLVRTDVDKDGNVTNVYKKTPVTNWVDKDGKKLQDTKEGSFPDNDGKSDITGYRLTKVDVDKDGNVTNTYEKIVKTDWVDESGKKLQDTKEGSFPDNDGKSDITGYTLVRTDIDKDGNVVNVYKADAKKVTTYWVDKSGKLLTPEETGEKFGDQKDFDGYKLVDTRMSPDGTKKYYVYEPVTPATPSTPATPAKSTPKQLPETGDATGLMSILAGTGLIGLAGSGFVRRKKSKKD